MKNYYEEDFKFKLGDVVYYQEARDVRKYIVTGTYYELGYNRKLPVYNITKALYGDQYTSLDQFGHGLDLEGVRKIREHQLMSEQEYTEKKLQAKKKELEELKRRQAELEAELNE